MLYFLPHRPHGNVNTNATANHPAFIVAQPGKHISRAGMPPRVVIAYRHLSPTEAGRMNGPAARLLGIGVAIGALSGSLAFGAMAAAWTRHHDSVQPRMELTIRNAQGAPINPREFVPVPPLNQPGNVPSQAPFPGTGSQQ